MSRNQDFSVVKTEKIKIPTLPFPDIKKAILGKKYILSLVFGTDQLLRKLNYSYRREKYTANVLSFSLSPNEGEIFISPRQAGKDSGRFGETQSEFLLHLFIHGLLHLKGYRHGSKMDKQERKFRRKFHI